MGKEMECKDVMPIPMSKPAISGFRWKLAHNAIANATWESVKRALQNQGITVMHVREQRIGPKGLRY